MNNKITAISLLTVLLTGCTTPVTYTNAPMTAYDKNTDYVVEDQPDGFDLTVKYSRFQMTPESDAVAIACKSALTSIAWDVAKKKGRDIQPVNEQRIRISMGRSEWTGITSCSANAPVKWAK